MFQFIKRIAWFLVSKAFEMVKKNAYGKFSSVIGRGDLIMQVD